MPQWDEKFFSLLNISWRNEFFDWFMPVASLRLPWIALFFLLSGWFFLRYRPENWRGILLKFCCVLLCLGATEPLTNISKDAIGRPRPDKAVAGAIYYADNNWHRLERAQDPLSAGDSFYSAHAANSAAFVVCLAMFFPKLRIWIFFIPLLVGYARIYMGRHYPLDIGGGWLVGCFMGWLGYKLSRLAEEHIPRVRRAFNA